MIPYEELERALTRWKARRAGAEGQGGPGDGPSGDGIPVSMTAAPVVYQRRETTGEVDLVDVVDET